MKLITLFTALIVSTMIFSQETTDYKKPAIDILTQTYKVLDDKVSNLTEAELRYVPQDDGWSILNNLEHLAFVEKVLNKGLSDMIEAGDIQTDKDLSMNDWLVISQVTDRTNKAKTPPKFEPQPELKDKGRDYFMAEIKKYRDHTLWLIKDSKLNLRKIFGPYLYGEADGLQQALIIGAHCYRHTVQIDEVLKEMYSEKEKE
ncbi:DinB family protein [uncultured Winogradskyella sp.]|uniref:DinB family protein n=1 Tax=uncultured Winogradskyella sp. TaxID=395353 RepID=UPI0026358EDD|nr:DinB family protein [uncultured Winogradskyella sp.]